MKDKTINYVLANAKKIDYDNIIVEALSKELNGTIDLETFDIDLNGVKMVPISDSSYVFAFPAKNELRMKKNPRAFQPYKFTHVPPAQAVLRNLLLILQMQLNLILNQSTLFGAKR